MKIAFPPKIQYYFIQIAHASKPQEVYHQVQQFLSISIYPWHHEIVQILNGVLLGDAFAPYLFAIELTYAMQQAINNSGEVPSFVITRQRSKRFQAITITDLDFVNYVVQVSDEIDQAQQLLSRKETSLAKLDGRLTSRT